MVDVDLDLTDDWEGEDWQKLAERAVARAFAVAEFVAETRISVSISLSGNDEVQALNAQWRGKDKPTNVLSFPMLEAAGLSQLKNRHPELVSGSIAHPEPKGSEAEWTLKQVQGDETGGEVLLGDIILAHGVCTAEAKEKSILLADHVTHLIVHGTLHLLGHDHVDDAQAEAMEALEVKALASLGIANPYSAD